MPCEFIPRHAGTGTAFRLAYGLSFLCWQAGDSGLLLACFNGHAEVARLCAEKGADVVNDRNQVSFDLASNFLWQSLARHCWIDR